MGKAVDINSNKKAVVQHLLLNTSDSISTIAKSAGISRRSVKRIKDKLAKGQSLEVQRRGRCGRKKIFTARAQRQLLKIVREERFATNSAITKQLNEMGIATSTVTVRRNLYRLGVKSRRPARKPKLTKL